MLILSIITFLIVGLGIAFANKFTPQIKTWFPYYAVTIGILFLIAINLLRNA